MKEDKRNPKKKKKLSRRRRFRRKLRIVIFLLVLAVFGILFCIYQRTAGVKNAKLTEDKTIAIFGVDSRDDNMERGNSDVIMVAHINTEDKTVKVASVYRDTFLDIGDETYRKCNAAYGKGGADQAVDMLNDNLDLDIEDYVTVDFKAVVKLIDILDGITMDLTGEEVMYLNTYCGETAQVAGTVYQPISPEAAGTYNLTGTQAVALCRVRYTAGGDFTRTERQREVMGLIVEKMKSMSVSDMMSAVTEVLPLVKTSYSKTEVLSMCVPLMKYSLGETTGFPFEHVDKKIDKKACVVATTLESNVIQLHEFFGDTDYTISDKAKEISDYIEENYGE